MSESKFPAGSSVKQLLHFAQLIKDKQFQHYDFRSDQANIKEYGQIIPPVIDLKKIQKVSVAMFVGKNDDVANPIDTRWAKKKVNTTLFYEEIDNFDHGSFTIGRNMSYLKDVLVLLNSYNKE